MQLPYFPFHLWNILNDPIYSDEIRHKGSVKKFFILGEDYIELFIRNLYMGDPKNLFE